MCLSLRACSTRLYNNSNIRYKLAMYNKHGDLCGPYQETRYRKNHWHRARPIKSVQIDPDGKITKVIDHTRNGYHVYVDKDVPERLGRAYGYALLTIRVKGFLRSGTGSYSSDRQETWERFKILSVSKTHY